MKTGLDRLLAEPALCAPLAGRRVALVAHPASLTHSLVHALDALAACPDVKLTAAFGPQHGLKGDKQDNMVESPDYRDPALGIPIFSLYGQVRRPTPAMIDTADVFLFDLQDLGCRIYTFVTTLLYLLEACHGTGKAVWVLDRPNPAGRPVEGTRLVPGWESFVGAGPMPMRHGMTLGELALLARHDLKLDTELHVVPAKGWKRSLYFDQTGLPFLPPSPNLKSVEALIHYPGVCLFEGTNLSVGRGTEYPFEQVGAPWLDTAKVLSRLREERLPGIEFSGVTFTPRQPGDGKYADTLVEGIRFRVVDRSTYDPTRTAVTLLQILSHSGLSLLQRQFDRLAGDGGELGKQIFTDQIADWERARGEFLTRRRPFLLYPE